MSQKYFIKKLPTKDVSVIVYSLSYDSPMNYLSSIEKDLTDNGVKGRVCFDLLLSNGNTSDRFYSAFFDGKKITHNSIKKETEIAKEIYEYSLNFYSGKEECLTNSVLNKAQRFLIKNKKHLLRI